MRIREPDYYKAFRCLAGACPHTCCAGWEVVVDPETAARYQALSGALGAELRAALIPVTQFGSAAAWPLVLIGLLFNNNTFFVLGMVFFLLATLFQLVTLPVEFNASNRALAALSSSGILEQDEIPMARKTLSAAAMTYVAALAVSVAQLLRLLLIFGGGRRDD